MTDFLLEILSEEIPAVMQKAAAENLARIASEVFAKNNLKFENSQLKTFVSPRRLSLYLSGLESGQKVPAVKRVGPKVGADVKAVEGFLRSVGLSSESQLEKVDNGGALCYAYSKPASEINTAEIIKLSVPNILQKMVSAWPKLMRWDIEEFFEEQPQWIRPIRNILCLFGTEIIALEFAGLKSNNITFGHALIKEQLTISDATNYQKTLSQNFVIVDHVERKQKILSQISAIKTSLGLETIDDLEKSALFDEITGLCEWPTALSASIDGRFIELPDEILVLTLKLNQKYICLKNSEGILAPKFIFIVGNIINEKNQGKIIHDNEKLVRARLSDAEFFISEDLKKPLIDRFDELKKVVFHQKLGSIHDKVARLNSLAKFLSIFVPHSDLSIVERAADLCKIDLITKAVAELPELQGKIGGFYAHKQKEDKRVIAAIYEHYLPLGPTSELPKTPLGIALSISDKIDSIVGFYLADEKPTSSKDPYALRRAALGIIRIAFQNNIAFPIRILIEKSLNAYQTKLVKNLLNEKEGKFFDKKKLLVEEIIRFFVERLKVYLKENEAVQPDIVNVVLEKYLSDLDAHRYFDILYLAKKIRFLDGFVKNKENAGLLELYKRSANILAIEEKKDGIKYDDNPSRLGFKSKYETSLFRFIKQISSEFKKFIIKGEFEAAFKLLKILEVPLSQFFDNVVVNDPDKGLRQNRLSLLSQIRALFNQVGDLSKIEIS